MWKTLNTQSAHLLCYASFTGHCAFAQLQKPTALIGDLVSKKIRCVYSRKIKNLFKDSDRSLKGGCSVILPFKRLSKKLVKEKQ